MLAMVMATAKVLASVGQSFLAFHGILHIRPYLENSQASRCPIISRRSPFKYMRLSI